MVLKTKIINQMFRLLMEYGILSVHEMQEKMNINISKSTIYRYLNELFDRQIIGYGWDDYSYELIGDNVKITCQLRRIK